jgi:hypothetical protein
MTNRDSESIEDYLFRCGLPELVPVILVGQREPENTDAVMRAYSDLAPRCDRGFFDRLHRAIRESDAQGEIVRGFLLWAEEKNLLTLLGINVPLGPAADLHIEESLLVVERTLDARLPR